MISALETNKEIESFQEENVQIIEQLVTVLETDKEMIPSLRDVPKKELLEEAAKVDKVLGTRYISYFMQRQLLFPIG